MKKTGQDDYLKIAVHNWYFCASYSSKFLFSGIYLKCGIVRNWLYAYSNGPSSTNISYRWKSSTEHNLHKPCNSETKWRVHHRLSFPEVYTTGFSKRTNIVLPRRKIVSTRIKTQMWVLFFYEPEKNVENAPPSRTFLFNDKMEKFENFKLWDFDINELKKDIFQH